MIFISFFILIIIFICFKKFRKPNIIHKTIIIWSLFTVGIICAKPILTRNTTIKSQTLFINPITNDMDNNETFNTIIIDDTVFYKTNKIYSENINLVTFCNTNTKPKVTKYYTQNPLFWRLLTLNDNKNVYETIIYIPIENE